MPVGFNSAARNLFLLGSSGADLVTNFFKTIDKSAGTDGVYLPDEIRYNVPDQKFLLSGSAEDSNSKGFGWFEKRTQAGTADWNVKVEATTSANTTLRAMELDSNDNLIVVGKTGDIPWIAKYSNGGVIDWQSTTNSGDVEYTGITSDANGNYYACGSTPVSGQAQAFVEKFDSSGTPGWGKSAFMLGRDVVLNKVAANSRGEVVAVGYLEDDRSTKGYIVKIDTTTGEVLWDRTIDDTRDYFGNPPTLNVTDVYIDSNDQIYVTGSVNRNSTKQFLIKYTAEGNIIWQTESGNNILTTAVDITPVNVKSDGETEQTIIASTYTAFGFGGLLLTKYSKDGTVVWRRLISSSHLSSNVLHSANLDADPSFYYILYSDDSVSQLDGTPDRYTFGKVSTSGNGLGAFQYAEGTGEIIDYEISSLAEKIGRLSDGSVRQDTSDLITYPFNANKLLFDDLATQVSNKKRQMDSADSFEYSGSLAIRPADFQELNLLGDNVSGRTWTDSSGKGNNGVASLTEPFSGAGSVSFDGTGDYLTVGGPLQTTNAGLDLGTNDFCIEYWVYQEVSSYASECFLFDLRETSNNTSTTAFIVNASNQLRWYWGNADRITVNNFIEQNQWTHHAFVRNGDVFTVYKNGTSAGSATIVGQNLGTVPTPCVIGASRSGGSPVQAKYSNFRITIENPVYTGNFTPPAVSLSPVAGTELLTCQGDTIADASSNNFTITVNGNAAPTDDGPTHNAAGYWEFDGVDDYISIADDPSLHTEEMSWEWWMWNDTIDNSLATAFFTKRTSNTNGYMIFTQPGGVINFDFGAPLGDRWSTGYDVSSNLNQWIHCVMTRSSSGRAFYVNGTQYASTSNAGNYIANPFSIDLIIGADSSNAQYYVDGRIGEVRIYPRALTPAQVFQNYNATREKYTGVPASTDPGLTSTRTPA
jgi:hypothetical protein